METDTLKIPKGFQLDAVPPEGFVVDRPMAEPNVFDGLIDPNEIDKKAKDVLTMAEKAEVPFDAVMYSFDTYIFNEEKISAASERMEKEFRERAEARVIPISGRRIAFESLKGVARFLERDVGGVFGGTMYNWLGQLITEGGRAVDWMSKVGTKNKHQIYNPDAQAIMATGQNISQRGIKARDWWAYQAATGWEAMDKDLKEKDPISYGAGRISEGVASSALSVLAVYLSGGVAAPAAINKGIEINRGLIALSTLSAAGGFEHAQAQKENFLWSTVHGLADGAIEYAMESAFLEGIKTLSKTAVAFKEAMEELFTGLMQNTRAGVLENINKGMSIYEASKKAIFSALKQAPWEVAAGFIGGYGIAGGAQLTQLYEQSKMAGKEGEISPETQEIMNRRAAKIEEIVEEGGIGALQKVRAEIKAGKEELAVAEVEETVAEFEKEIAGIPAERVIPEPTKPVAARKPAEAPAIPPKAIEAKPEGEVKTVYRVGDLEAKVSTPPDLKGIYFADHKEMAETFAGIEGAKFKEVKQYRIELKNPATEEIENQVARDLGIPSGAADIEGLATAYGLPLYTQETAKQVADELQKRGYDGVIRKNGEIVVFDKSAIEPAKVEPEGEVVYHGTTAESAETIKKKGFKPKIINGQLYGSGVYLAPTKAEAARYGDEVIPIKTNIKNPFVLDLDKYRSVEEWYAEIQPEIDFPLTDDYGAAITVHTLDLEGKEISSLKPEAVEAADAITGYLQEKGYDSLIVKEKGETREIVIFDPKQVELVKPPAKLEGEMKPKVEPEAKPMKAPIEQLGGLPIEPPGLTREETAHLGKREGDALRAGQKLGLKIGYKKGYQEAALKGRRELNVLRMDKAISQKSKEDVRKTIQNFVPKDEQYRFMTRLGRVKDAKGVQKLTGEIEHFIEQYEHRAAVRHFKNFVSGMKKKYKTGEVAFGQLPDNLRKKVMGVIDTYDAVRLSEAKAEELTQHKEHIQKVAGSIADAFAHWENLDEQGLDILQLPNYRITALQRLEKKPVADLSTEEIEFIQDELEGLLAVNEKKGQVKARIRAEKLHTKVTGASNEIYSRGETRKGEIKEPGYAKRFAGIEQANLRTLVGMATKSENKSTVNLLVNQLYEANRKRADNYKGFIEYTRKQIAKRKITFVDVKGLDKPVTVTLGGKEITISQGSLLSLWMDTEAEGNMRRLLTARGHNLWSDKGKRVRIGKITLQEIQDAVEKLSPKAKSIGEIAFSTNFNMQAPALNETWIDLYNYPIARHERHWPFPREIEKLVEGPRADISLSMEMQGRYLPRTGGIARHNVIPFTKQFMKGLQADAATAAMSDSMQQAKALLANKKWRQRMKDSGQQPVLDAITTMLRRSQGMASDQSVADLAAARFLSRAGKSLLSARPSGMLIQTASVSAGYGVIEPKHFMTLKVPTKAEIEHLKEISPSLWLRWEAKQFDYALGAASAQTGFQTLIMEKQPISDRLVNHYTWGDQIAVFYGWTAAQNKVASETTLRKGTPEFEKASLDLLHKWIETQPQWDILHRSLLTSHPSPWFRGSMMFMSARNAQYNVLLSAYDDYAKGRINEAEFAARTGGIVQANIQVSLARRLMRYGVKAGALAVLFSLLDEDKELIKQIAKEEAIKDIKKVPLESAMNLLGLSAFGQIGATVGYEAVRQIEGKTFPKKLSEARTGNIIADIFMDFTQFGIDSAKLAKQLWTQEVYVDRERMGEPRWKDTAIDLTNTAAEIAAQIIGMPYSGPRSDIVWPVQSVLRGMSRDEYEKARKEFNEARRKALQEAIKEKVKTGELPRKR